MPSNELQSGSALDLHQNASETRQLERQQDIALPIQMKGTIASYFNKRSASPVSVASASRRKIEGIEP